MKNSEIEYWLTFLEDLRRTFRIYFKCESLEEIEILEQLNEEIVRLEDEKCKKKIKLV